MVSLAPRREGNGEDGLSFLQEESKERAGKPKEGGWFFQVKQTNKHGFILANIVLIMAPLERLV